MRIIVTFQDRSLRAAADKLDAISSGKGRALLSRALNTVGEEIRSNTVQAETAQTGLPADTIDRAQQTINASPAALTFTIKAKGGDVRLKYFGPKETAGGVTAKPWNAARMYRGAFMTSGRLGSRKLVSKLNGHVFRNVQGGKWHGRIAVARSGLYIPDEMLVGQTAAAFDRGVSQAGGVLVNRIGALLP